MKIFGIFVSDFIALLALVISYLAYKNSKKKFDAKYHIDGLVMGINYISKSELATPEYLNLYLSLRNSGHTNISISIPEILFQKNSEKKWIAKPRLKEYSHSEKISQFQSHEHYNYLDEFISLEAGKLESRIFSYKIPYGQDFTKKDRDFFYDLKRDDLSFFISYNDHSGEKFIKKVSDIKSCDEVTSLLI